MQDCHRNTEQPKNCYDRLAIKGFQWLETRILEPLTESTNQKAFRSFKLKDEKKKWKKNKSKCFQGLGQKISKILQAKSHIKEANTKQLKEELYVKNLQQIELKNKCMKIKKSNKVLQIYEQQKGFRASVINDYFDQQTKWINQRAKIN